MYLGSCTSLSVKSTVIACCVLDSLYYRVALAVEHVSGDSRSVLRIKLKEVLSPTRIELVFTYARYLHSL